jgi:trimethylguanosine synthase
MSGYKESMRPSSYDITVSNKRTCSAFLISQYEYDGYDNSYPIYECNKSAVERIAWEKFWAKNGEQLIWASWTQKYADYINPDYFQNNTHAARDEKSQDADINEVATEKYFE